MGTPYTPSPVAIGTVTVPADGDARNAAVFNVPMQAVADGVKFATVRTDVLANLAALTAIPAPTVGTVRLVSGVGLYTFEASPPGGPSPYRLTPDDATSGGWVSATAHETTITKYVAFNQCVAATTAALTPAINLGWTPYSFSASGAAFNGTSLLPGAASVGATAWGFMIPIDRYLVDGSTLASALLRYTPGHATAPTTMLQYALVRSTRTGTVPTSVHLRAAGFVVDSGGVWTSGTDRTVAYASDQNALIDLTTYSYSIIVFDEHGTNAAVGGALHVVALTMTGIPDARR
jgi:hypothetical protein